MIQKGSTRNFLITAGQLRAARGLIGLGRKQTWLCEPVFRLPTVKRVETDPGIRASEDSACETPAGIRSCRRLIHRRERRRPRRSLAQAPTGEACEVTVATRRCRYGPKIFSIDVRCALLEACVRSIAWEAYAARYLFTRRNTAALAIRKIHLFFRRICCLHVFSH